MFVIMCQVFDDCDPNEFTQPEVTIGEDEFKNLCNIAIRFIFDQVPEYEKFIKQIKLIFDKSGFTDLVYFDDVPFTEEIEPKNDGKVLQNRAEPVEYKAEKANLSSEGTQHSDDESPMDIHAGFTTTEDEYIADEENIKQPSKHTARIIIIAVAAVVAMILGALAFIAFALPNITGESNPVSEMFTGKKEPEFTPEKLVAKYEEAFNAGDRDAIAKLYLPDQSLKRNIEGGAYEMVQKLSDYLLGEKVTIKCELKDDLKYEGDTATGTVKISIDLPDINGQDVGFIVNLLGIETEKEKPVTFERYTDGNWYFKEF